MRALSKEITDREINLAQQIFILGVEVGCGEHNYDFELFAHKIKEMLSRADNDKTMTYLLQQIFESGMSVGEKRMRKKM